MLHYLKLLADYNCWANKKMVTFVAEAGDEVVNLNKISSFPSINKTIFHIWDAESIWLDRLKGNPGNSKPGNSFKGSFKDACANFLETSFELQQFVAAIGELNVRHQIEYKSINGKPNSSTFQEVITHIVNHGTFHRGQLITMLRCAGFTNLDSTDLITYYREKH